MLQRAQDVAILMKAGSTELLRGLGRTDIVALTLNNMIGAGIFTLPAALAAGAGRWSLAVLLVTLVLASLMALCMVEVASRYDVTGGPMVYAGNAFGPLAGFLVGWLMYLSRLASFGAVAAIMLDYGTGLWPALGVTAVRTLAITVFIGALAAINLRGVVRGAQASNILTALKLLPLVLLAGVGLAGWPSGPSAAPPGLGELGGAVFIAFYACMGFEQAAVIAGEARNPHRDLPAGILGGIVGVGVLYSLLMLACFQTVPDLAHARRPLADAAAALVGPQGATVMSLTAVLSCAGGLSGWMIVSPRVLYALARQGDLPRVFAALDPVRQIPGVAIVSSAMLVWVLTVSGTFVYLATFSAIARLLMYASTCAALIVFRRRDGPAPIPIPLGPLWGVLALACSLLALGTTTGTAVRDVSIAIGLGLAGRTAARLWNKPPVVVS
jgi:APA family basic amino acid/polyamine antiporter